MRSFSYTDMDPKFLCIFEPKCDHDGNRKRYLEINIPWRKLL